jgi:hypothetical protein
MGLEARCTLDWQGRSTAGTALLETTEILFRGAVRLKIPRARITAFAAEGGALRVTFGGETATFALGAAAEKWARALGTTKSRLDKLGVAKGQVVSVVGVEDASFRDELRARIGAFTDGAPADGSDVLFYGVQAAADLERLPAMRAALAPAGALWVIRPKGGGAAVTEAEVMAAGKRAGLVDVKVASFSDTHSALKFVIPVAARGEAAKAPKVAKTPKKK